MVACLVRREAYVLAHIDAFWLIASVSLLGMILILLLRPPPPKPLIPSARKIMDADLADQARRPSASIPTKPVETSLFISWTMARTGGGVSHCGAMHGFLYQETSLAHNVISLFSGSIPGTRSCLRSRFFGHDQLSAPDNRISLGSV